MLTIKASIESDDPTEWELVKTKLKVSGKGYVIDDTKKTACITFNAEYDDSSEIVINLEKVNE